MFPQSPLVPAVAAALEQAQLRVTVAAALFAAFAAASSLLRAMLQGFRAALSPLPGSGSLAQSSSGPTLPSTLLLFASVSQSAASSSTPLTVVASGMAKWLELYSGLLLVRVLLSWFPNIDWERQPMQAIRDMSDPYLNLFRNILVGDVGWE